MINKYRPQKLDDIFGQKATVQSLKALKTLPHAFLFHGPSGTGKTTISRILQTLIPCQKNDINEIDAATNTGVDDVRELLKTIPFQSFGSGKKLIIIDECHMLSKAAWNALLKILEEPPEHVYFSLCTTEFKKVPTTVRTRCHIYELNNLTNKELEQLVEFVCKEEGLQDSLIYNDEEIFHNLIASCCGCARQALVFISACGGIADPKTIEQILQAPGENKQVIDFCRDLIKCEFNHKKIITFLKMVKTEKLNPETVRIQIAGYLTACLLGSESVKSMLEVAVLLDIFSQPIYNQSTGFQDLVLMVMNLFE